MPVDLETLPMMLKFGIILDNDLHKTGQTPILLHLNGLKAVMFSYVFINACLMTKMNTSNCFTAFADHHTLANIDSRKP